MLKELAILVAVSLVLIEFPTQTVGCGGGWKVKFEVTREVWNMNNCNIMNEMMNVLFFF